MSGGVPILCPWISGISMAERPVARDWRRFVALGDSFTEGLMDEVGPDGRHRGWADRVAEALAARAAAGGADGIEYANLAVRGRLVRQVIDEQVPAAVALGPDLASIAVGVNDTLRPRYDVIPWQPLSRTACASFAGAAATSCCSPSGIRPAGRGRWHPCGSASGRTTRRSTPSPSTTTATSSASGRWPPTTTTDSGTRTGSTSRRPAIGWLRGRPSRRWGSAIRCGGRPRCPSRDPRAGAGGVAAAVDDGTPRAVGRTPGAWGVIR